MNSGGTDSEWSSADSVVSNSSGVSLSRSKEDIAGKLPFEDVPLDRLPIDQQIVKRNDRYDLYRKDNTSSSNHFGIICKYESVTIFVVMGDVVHKDQIFVCATLVDPEEFPETTIDGYITLLSRGGSKNGGEEPFEEYVYETINEFVSRSKTLWETKGKRQKVAFEGMKKLLGVFKTEMNAGKSSTILNVHLANKKDVTDLTVDEDKQLSPDNGESEREPPILDNNGADTDADFKTPSKTKRGTKPKVATEVVLRPQSSREAAKNKPSRYTPESIEPKKKSAAGGVQIKSKTPAVAAGKSRSKSVGSRTNTSSSSWSGSSYDDSTYGYYDDDSSYFVENARQSSELIGKSRIASSNTSTNDWRGENGRNKTASAGQQGGAQDPVVAKLVADFAEYKRQTESREADMSRQLTGAQGPASTTPAVQAAAPPVFEESKFAAAIATAVVEALAATNKNQVSVLPTAQATTQPAAHNLPLQLGNGGVQYPNPCGFGGGGGGLPNTVVVMPPQHYSGPATLDPNLAAYFLLA